MANMKKPFVPSWLFEQGFNAYQVAIFCYISMRGKCFENKRTIAKNLGMSKDTFYRTLKPLIDRGWVTRKQGKTTILQVTTNGKELLQQPKTEKAPVLNQGHDVSYIRDMTCPKSGTLTNQVTNQVTITGRENLFALVYNAGKSMRGTGPTMEERTWKEAIDD
jgi:DNA-binding MarR family transcriptional regulator